MRVRVSKAPALAKSAPFCMVATRLKVDSDTTVDILLGLCPLRECRTRHPCLGASESRRSGGVWTIDPLVTWAGVAVVFAMLAR